MSLLLWKSLYCPHNNPEFKIGEREAAANEDYKREGGMSKIEKICQDKGGDPEEAIFRACMPAMPSRTWGSRKIRGISSERQSQRALFLSYLLCVQEKGSCHQLPEGSLHQKLPSSLWPRKGLPFTIFWRVQVIL